MIIGARRLDGVRRCRCRGCGCTAMHACPGGCAWVLLDLNAPTGVCSACAAALEWEPLLLAQVGFGDEAAA